MKKERECGIRTPFQTLREFSSFHHNWIPISQAILGLPNRYFPKRTVGCPCIAQKVFSWYLCCVFRNVLAFLRFTWFLGTRVPENHTSTNLILGRASSHWRHQILCHCQQQNKISLCYYAVIGNESGSNVTELAELLRAWHHSPKIPLYKGHNNNKTCLF